jgi:hypothetical protein
MTVRGRRVRKGEGKKEKGRNARRRSGWRPSRAIVPFTESFNSSSLIPGFVGSASSVETAQRKKLAGVMKRKRGRKKENRTLGSDPRIGKVNAFSSRLFEGLSCFLFSAVACRGEEGRPVSFAVTDNCFGSSPCAVSNALMPALSANTLS